MTNFEKLASNLAVTFVNLPADKIDDFIDIALGQIVQYLGVDRATFYQYDNDALITTHCWARKGIPTRIKFSFIRLFPYIYSQIKDNQNIKFFHISKFPDEAKREKVIFSKNYGPKLMICDPIFANQRNIGYISFGSMTGDIFIPDDKINNLRLLTTLIANALLKKYSSKKQYEIKKSDKIESVSHFYQYSIKNQVEQFLPSSSIIGKSSQINNLLLLARKVATSDTTVLIQGETGTGKELLARYIHNLSLRHSSPMFSVNCAVFSNELINSELFGHERGAFTGAIHNKSGLFEKACGSTLFFDEIAEMSADCQAKLLRVIQERQFTKIGSTTPINANVRLIAATNRDLQEEVSDGRFRKDLYYRLNVFPLLIPPLRERPEDIPCLVMAFIAEFNRIMHKNITRVNRDDMLALQDYAWPGNVRELRNVVERAMILADSHTLRISPPASNAEKLRIGISENDPILSLVEAEKKYIRMALRKTGGRISGAHGAAAILDINPKTLESRMRKLGIKRI